MEMVYCKQTLLKESNYNLYNINVTLDSFTSCT